MTSSGRHRATRRNPICRGPLLVAAVTAVALAGGAQFADAGGFAAESAAQASASDLTAQRAALVLPVAQNIRPDELVQQRLAQAAERERAGKEDQKAAEKKAAAKKAAAKKAADKKAAGAKAERKAAAADAREIADAYADAYASAYTKALKEARLRTARALAASGASSLPVHGAVVTAGFAQVGPMWKTVHTGLDLACPIGTPVLAAAAGTIVSAADDGPYGLRIKIRHPDGTETWYGHLSTFVVAAGQVRAGQVIGLSGNTGHSSGPHLHFGVLVRGSLVDPQIWLRARGLFI